MPTVLAGVPPECTPTFTLSWASCSVSKFIWVEAAKQPHKIIQNGLYHLTLICLKANPNLHWTPKSVYLKHELGSTYFMCNGVTVAWTNTHKDWNVSIVWASLFASQPLLIAVMEGLEICLQYVEWSDPVTKDPTVLTAHLRLRWLIGTVCYAPALGHGH